MINHDFVDWQRTPPPATHDRCSPALLLLLAEVQRRWDFFASLGCYGVRPIRGGTAPSSHSQGAAIDIGYPADADGVVELEVCGFLVGRSLELGVQAVHDYRRCRIWRAGRTGREEDACSAWWKAQRRSPISGMGMSWANHLHVEVTRDAWADETPISARWDE